MPPHSTLIEKSEEQLRSLNNAPQIYQPNSFLSTSSQLPSSNSSSSISNLILDSSITNAQINNTTTTPTPLPILSSTFNFNIIESDFNESSSLDNYPSSEQEYIESFVEQMEDIVSTDYMFEMFETLGDSNALNTQNKMMNSGIMQQSNDYLNMSCLNQQQQTQPAYQNTQTTNGLPMINDMMSLNTQPSIAQVKIKQESLSYPDESNSSYSYSENSYGYPLSTSTSRRGGKLGSSEKRYGPIVVRPRKNPAPTLASGRKSKYISLNPDEERKRDIRRTRNRQAAEKCKLKRNEIEDKLELTLNTLRAEQAALLKEREALQAKKLSYESAYNKHIETCKSSPLLISQLKNTANSNILVQPNYQLSYNTSQPQQSYMSNSQMQMMPSSNYQNVNYGYGYEQTMNLQPQQQQHQQPHLSQTYQSQLVMPKMSNQGGMNYNQYDNVNRYA